MTVLFLSNDFESETVKVLNFLSSL